MSTKLLFRKVLISRVFKDIRDRTGDINIPDLEKTLSDDAEVAGTQNGRDRYHYRNQDKSCFEKT